MSQVTASRDSSAYSTNTSLLPGHSLPWLNALRREALEEFTTHGFPKPREEEWRYTNVSAIEKKHFTPALETSSASLNVTPEAFKSFQLKDTWSVVLINGRFSAELSELDGLPETVSVISMADALAKQPEVLENYLCQAVKHTEHGFIAFNTAWFSDGLFVHVPGKLKLAKPIQLLHWVTQPDALATIRNVIIVNDMAEVQLIETFAGDNSSYLTASVTEVFAGRNAAVTLYKLQCESEKAYHFGGVYIRQSQDARVIHHNFAFGGLLARSDIHVDLDLASACELNGLYLGVKRQHIDNHTRINHLKPQASSRELYKGVLDDRARGVFQGRVIVSEDAQNTDSQMNNRNLLLSNDAEADTKPQLEIYADDVKCGHGVTVGQLDEKSVFYLQSRSIDEETARNMLTFAFANEMVDKVTIKSLHDCILEQLLRRFPQEAVEKNWL